MSETNTQLLDFFKALADESRLKIVGLLAQQPRSVEELATLLKLGSPTISHHLGKLQKAGLVRAEAQQHYSIYSLKADQLQHLARTLLKPEAMTLATNEGVEASPDALVKKLLRQDGRIMFYDKGHRLTMALGWLQQKFETDMRYTEMQTGCILERWCAQDSNTLRRCMVDGKYLARKRDGSAYWRADSPKARAADFEPESLPLSTYKLPKQFVLEQQAFMDCFHNGHIVVPNDPEKLKLVLPRAWMLMRGRFAKGNAYTPDQVDAIILRFCTGDATRIRQLLVQDKRLSHDTKRGTYTIPIREQDEQYDQRVLAGFLVDGRLKEIPAQLKKRYAVLRWLADKFEPRKRYTEKQVNELLKQYHDDFASLRRYLIGEKFLDRKDGTYWRVLDTSA